MPRMIPLETAARMHGIEVEGVRRICRETGIQCQTDHAGSSLALVDADIFAVAFRSNEFATAVFERLTKTESTQADQKSRTWNEKYGAFLNCGTLAVALVALYLSWFGSPVELKRSNEESIRSAYDIYLNDPAKKTVPAERRYPELDSILERAETLHKKKLIGEVFWDKLNDNICSGARQIMCPKDSRIIRARNFPDAPTVMRVCFGATSLGDQICLSSDNGRK